MIDKNKLDKNDATILSSEAEALKHNNFDRLHKEAKAAFSVESLTERTGNKKFAEAFNKLLSFQYPYKEKEVEKATERLKKASGKPYSKTTDKHPYLLFGNALAKLYESPSSSNMMLNSIDKLTEHHISVNLFFALPSVVKELEHKSEIHNADYTAILALLSISEYGVDYDKEKLRKLADRLDYLFRNGQRENYRMRVTPARLRDIADGLYDTVLDDIRKLRALAIVAENAGQTENAAGYYFEAAKLADMKSIRDYLRLSTDLNRDIAETCIDCKDYKLFWKCSKSARNKKHISEQIAELQPAMDIYHPRAYMVASEYYRKAGDEVNAALMQEKAIRLGYASAIDKVFSFKNADMFAADTDSYMRYAFLLISKVARLEGKLVDGFNISFDRNQIDSFYDMLISLCAPHDFFDENDEKVPQLDDTQKRIVFAWVFRGAFDKRFDRYNQNALASLFNTGFGTPVNKPAAIAIWSDELANMRARNHADKTDRAAYFLGRAYLLGDGVERDKAKAVEYLNIAADYGKYMSLAKKLLELSDKSPTGLSNEGVICYKKGEYEKALGYFETAALLGSALGCRNAGVCHFNGHGTQINKSKAYEFFRMGADGDIQCAFNAGIECENNGNYASARVYYEKASAMEDVGNLNCDGKAALKLAQLYYNGKLTGKKDTLRYLFWMKKAMASGYTIPDENKKQFADTAVSSYEIMMAFNAVKLKQIIDEYSVFVLEKAVEANILGAQEELGVRYYTGAGVSVDKNKAFYLLTRAKAEAHTDKCEYYLACWCTDKAMEFYLGADTKNFYNTIRKAETLMDEVTEFEDCEDKCELIDALVEFAGFVIAFISYGDGECDESELEDKFESATELLLDLRDTHKEITVSMLCDAYMSVANDCDYLDEDERHDRLKIAYRYLYEGVTAGIKNCEETLATMTEDHFILGSQIFDTDEPEIALFYLNKINDTNVDAMRTTGGIYKLVYKDYRKALYYFDKALRAGSDDVGVFTEIGLMQFDSNGNYRPSEYGISKAQQIEYMKMSAANGCEKAQKVLAVLKNNNLI